VTAACAAMALAATSSDTAKRWVDFMVVSFRRWS
jgi:hypothetical protein